MPASSHDQYFLSSKKRHFNNIAEVARFFLELLSTRKHLLLISTDCQREVYLNRETYPLDSSACIRQNLSC